jgi:plastocyanin
MVSKRRVHMTKRAMRIVILSATLALVAAASACSSDQGESGASNPSIPADAGSPTDAEVTIAAQDFQFSPSSLAVPSGESTITVTNEGDVEHSFTLDDDSVSQDVEPGDSVSVTVDITDDAGFHCEYHPDTMTGTLSVS